MKNGIIFRQVEEKDAYSWVTLKNMVWRDAYKDIFPEEVFLEKERTVDEKVKTFNERIYNSNEKIAYVAEYKGKIVGLMLGEINSNYEYFKVEYADLEALYINPEFQGKGIAHNLREIFIKWAKNQGANKFVIGVLKDNQKARKVYEAWGGKLSDYETDFYQLGKPYKEVFYTYDI